jgi:hypothetical protein
MKLVLALLVSLFSLAATAESELVFFFYKNGKTYKAVSTLAKPLPSYVMYDGNPACFRGAVEQVPAIIKKTLAQDGLFKLISFKYGYDTTSVGDPRILVDVNISGKIKNQVIPMRFRQLRPCQRVSK